MVGPKFNIYEVTTHLVENGKKTAEETMVRVALDNKFVVLVTAGNEELAKSAIAGQLKELALRIERNDGVFEQYAL